MKVAIKNFFRNEMVNLTAKSVRHFLPGSEIHSFNFYKHAPSDYSTQPIIDKDIVQHYYQTKFVNPVNKPMDHEDSTKTSGYENRDNVCYFSEGLNVIVDNFRYSMDKLLIISEDHFFTTGETIKDLIDNDFTIAYAPWDEELDANASIICLKPGMVNLFFPIPENGEPVERHLKTHLVNRVPVENRFKIKTRKHANYFNDGKYTNSSKEIRSSLEQAGIL